MPTFVTVYIESGFLRVWIRRRAIRREEAVDLVHRELLLGHERLELAELRSNVAFGGLGRGRLLRREEHVGR